MPSYKELKLRQLKKKYETQYGVSQQDADFLASRDVAQQEQEQENDKADAWKRVVGTFSDIGNNIGKGFFGLFEGIIDAGAGLVALFGDDDFKKGVQDFQNIDLAEYVMEGTNLLNPGQQLMSLTTTGGFYDPFDFDNNNETNDTDKFSYVNELDEDGLISQSSVRGLAQAVGQVIGQVVTVGIAGALSGSATVAKGIGMTALGASSFGSGMAQANQEGADYWSSMGYGALNAGKEVGTELLVGKAVSKVSGASSAVGGALVKGSEVGSSVASRFSNKAIKSFSSYGARKFLTQIVSEFTEEGLEEAVGSLVEPLIQKWTYKQGKSYDEIFEENGGFEGVLQDFLVGGISGGIAGGFQTGAEIKSVGKAMGSTTVKGNFEAYGVQNAIAEMCDADERLGIEMLKIKGGVNEDVSLDELKNATSIRDFIEKFDNIQNKIKNGEIQMSNEIKAITEAINDKKAIIEKFQNAFEEYAKAKGLTLDEKNNGIDINMSNEADVEEKLSRMNQQEAIDTYKNLKNSTTEDTLKRTIQNKVFNGKVKVEFGKTNNFNRDTNTITLSDKTNDSVSKLFASLGHETAHKFGTDKFRNQLLKAMGISQAQVNDMANAYALRKGRDANGKFTNYEKLFREEAKSKGIKEGTQEYSDARREFFKDEITADLFGVYLSKNFNQLLKSVEKSDANFLKRAKMTLEDIFKNHQTKEFRKAMKYFEEGIREDTKKTKKEAKANEQYEVVDNKKEKQPKPQVAYSLDEDRQDLQIDNIINDNQIKPKVDEIIRVYEKEYPNNNKYSIMFEHFDLLKKDFKKIYISKMISQTDLNSLKEIVNELDFKKIYDNEESLNIKKGNIEFTLDSENFEIIIKTNDNVWEFDSTYILDLITEKNSNYKTAFAVFYDKIAEKFVLDKQAELFFKGEGENEQKTNRRNGSYSYEGRNWTRNFVEGIVGNAIKVDGEISKPLVIDFGKTKQNYTEQEIKQKNHFENISNLYENIIKSYGLYTWERVKNWAGYRIFDEYLPFNVKEIAKQNKKLGFDTYLEFASNDYLAFSIADGKTIFLTLFDGMKNSNRHEKFHCFKNNNTTSRFAYDFIHKIEDITKIFGTKQAKNTDSVWLESYLLDKWHYPKTKNIGRDVDIYSEELACELFAGNIVIPKYQAQINNAIEEFEKQCESVGLNKEDVMYSLDEADSVIEKQDELLQSVYDVDDLKKTKEYSNLSFNEKEGKKINKIALTKYLTDAEKEPFMKEMKLGKETKKLFDANKAGDWLLEQLKDYIKEENGEIVPVERKVETKTEPKLTETTKPTVVKKDEEVKEQPKNTQKITNDDLKVDINKKPNEELLNSKLTVTQATKFIQNVEASINEELLNISKLENDMYNFTTFEDYKEFENRGKKIQQSFAKIEEYRKLANTLKNNIIKSTTQQSSFEDKMDKFTRTNNYQSFDDEQNWNNRSKNFNKKFNEQKEANKKIDFNAMSANLVSKQLLKSKFEDLVYNYRGYEYTDEIFNLRKKIREELNDFNNFNEEKVEKMIDKLTNLYNELKDKASGLTSSKKRLQDDLDRIVSKLTDEQLNNDKVKEKINSIKQKIDNLKSGDVVKVSEDKNGRLKTSVETLYDRELAIRAEITGNVLVKKSDLTNEETYTQTGNGLIDIADKAKPKEASTNDNLLSIVEDYELDEVFQDGSTEDNHLAYNIYKVESYLDEDGVYSLSSITNADGREKKSIKSFHKNFVSMFKNIQKGFNKVVGYIDESVSNFEDGSEEDIKYYLDLIQSMADSEFLDEDYIRNAVDFVKSYNTELKEAQNFLKSKELSKALEDKDLTKLNELLSKNKYFKNKSFSETADAKTFIEKVLNMETINEGRYDFASCIDIIAEISEYAETNDFEAKHIQEFIESKKRILETEKSKKKTEKVVKNEIKENKVEGEAVVEKVNLEPNNTDTKEVIKDVKPEKVEKTKQTTENKPKETKPKSKKKRVSGYYVDERTVRRYYEKDRVATETAETVKNWAEVHKNVVYNQNAGEAIVDLTYSVMNKKKTVMRFVFNSRKLGTNGVEFVMLDILKVLNEYKIDSMSNEQKISQIYEILKEGLEVITLVPQFDNNGKLKGSYETFTKIDENLEKEEYVQKILTTLKSSITEIVNNASRPSVLTTKLNELSEKYNKDLDKIITKVNERLTVENELNKKIYDLEKKLLKGKITEAELNNELEKIEKSMDKVDSMNDKYNKLKEKFAKVKEELKKKYNNIAKRNRQLQRQVENANRRNTALRTSLYGEKIITGKFDKFISKTMLENFFENSKDTYVENYDEIAMYVAKGDFDTASRLYADSVNLKIDEDYYKVSEVLSDETYTEFIEYTKEAFEEFAKNSPDSALSKWNEKLAKLKEKQSLKYKDLKRVSTISNQLKNKYNSLNRIVFTKGSGTASPVLTQFRSLVAFLKNPTVNKLYNGKVRAEFKKFYQTLKANSNLTHIEIPEILTNLFEDVVNNENSASIEEIEKYVKLVNGITDFIERAFTDKGYKLVDENGNVIIKKGSEIVTETIKSQKNQKKEKFHSILYNSSDQRVFIEHLDGNNKKGFFHRIFNRLFQGQYKDKVELWKKLVKPYAEFKNKNKKFLKNFGDMVQINVLGKDINITKGEALILAEYLTDENARNHITNNAGGLEIDSQIYKMTVEQLNEFTEELNKTLNLDKDSVEKEYIKLIDKLLKQAGQVKYVTDIENYGFSNVDVLTDEDGNVIDKDGNIIEDLKNNVDKIVLTSKYFPNIVSDLSLSQNLSNGRAMQQVVAKAKQFSFNYDRTSYNGALRLADIDDVVDNHLEQMTTYGALSGAIIDFNNLYNKKMSEDVDNNISSGDSIASSVKSRFGQNKNGKFYVDDFLKGWTSDIQGMARTSDTMADNKIKKYVGKIRSNFAKFALFGYVKVAITQTASYFSSMKYVNILRLGQAVVTPLSKVAPIPAYYNYRNKTDTVSSAYTLSDSANRALDKLGILINKADALTVKSIWKAICLQEGVDNTTDVNSEKYKKAENLWLKTVAETQPMYDSFSRSRMLNTTSELAKMFLMFQTQNNKNWSNLVEIVLNKVSPKQAVRTVAGISLSMLTFAFISEFFRHFIKDNDDDDEFFDWDLLSQTLSSIINVIPVIGSQIAINFDKPSKFEFNELSIGALTNINDVISNMNDFVSGDFSSISIKDYVDTVGKLTGIPTNNLYGIFNNMVRMTAQMTKNQAISDFYANQNTIYKGYKITNKTKVSEEIDKGNQTISKSYYKIWANKIMPLDDSTTDVLYNLYKQGVDFNFKSIPSYYKNENGDEVAIDSKKFRQTYKIAGEKVSQLKNSYRFNVLSEEQKSKAISKIFDTYFNLAKKKQTGESYKLIEALADSNYNLANAISYLVQIQDLQATKTQTRKEVVQKYINRISTTSQNKYIIYMLSGYKVPDSKKRMVMNYLRRYLPLSYIKDLLEG